MDNKDSYKNHLYALILAGGGGTRLWPKSLEKTPKQFLPLFGKKTLMQITAERLSKIVDWERIVVVTVSGEYKLEIIKEVPQIPPQNIIVEPARRETGPAHGLGAMHILKRDPDAVIMTEAADRLVDPVSVYLDTLQKAAKVAYEEKVMVAMGVEPRYPHTGLGHIRRGELVKKMDDVSFYKLEEFVEKPQLELAKKYTSSGDYYWNAGQFVWRADTLLDAIAKHAPEVSDGLKKVLEVLGKDDEKEKISEIYESMPKISIDLAVAEKAKNFLVVEGLFHWTDVGDWKEVWENMKKDEWDNVIIDGDSPGGSVYNIGTTDSLIHTDGRMIAVVDVDNIVIVDTKEALLVCSKSKAQDVKKIVEILKEQQREDLL